MSAAFLFDLVKLSLVKGQSTIVIGPSALASLASLALFAAPASSLTLSRARMTIDWRRLTSDN
jgi:hypothetical protein